MQTKTQKQFKKQMNKLTKSETYDTYRDYHETYNNITFKNNPIIKIPPLLLKILTYIKKAFFIGIKLIIAVIVIKYIDEILMFLSHLK